MNEAYVTVIQDRSGGGWWHRVRLVRNDRQSISIRQFTDPSDCVKYAHDLADFLGCKVSGA